MRTPNILLVVLDSVRARNTGAYGYQRDTTPFLSEYASGATVYDQARAPGIHSVASHASMWTGLHVESHEVVQHEDQLKEGTTIWETLNDEGYRTGIFTTNTVVTHASNLADPFDTKVTDNYVDTTKKLFSEAHGPADTVTHDGIVGNLKRCLEDDNTIKSLANSAYHYRMRQRNTGSSLSSTEIVDRFAEWVSDSNEPWAACINLMDAHYPYKPSPEFNLWGDTYLRELHAELDRTPSLAFVQNRPWWQLEAFKHLYDGAIRELDTRVKEIITTLKECGMHDDTLVVITSDHGEGFGEVSRITNRTKLVDHSWGIHEVLTHVPLLVKYPEQTERETVDAPASLVEFPNTVRTVLDGELARDTFIPESPVVSSTRRLFAADEMIFDGSDEDVADYYGTWQAVYEAADNGVYKYACRDGDTATIHIRSPGNVCCVGDGNSEYVVSVFEELEEGEVKKDHESELSQEVEDALTDLGYLR